MSFTAPPLLDFLTEELDTRLVFPCDDNGAHELPPEAGSLQQPPVVQGLVSHVTFPTYEVGGSLEPVLADLTETSIVCQPLGPVGSSDHYAVLAQVQLNMAKEDDAQCNICTTLTERPSSGRG